MIQSLSSIKLKVQQGINNRRCSNKQQNASVTQVFSKFTQRPKRQNKVLRSNMNMEAFPKVITI